MPNPDSRQAWLVPLRLAVVFVLVVLVQAAAPALGSATVGSLSPSQSVDPLALTPEMKTFVDTKVGRRQSPQARLLALRDAIFDPEEGMGVTYGSTSTYTAAETMREGTGNCLSFTMLYVALARYLDLNAYFVEVDEVTGWSQRGDVGFSHWHMYAEVEFYNGVAPVDFLPWTERRYRSRRRIPESRARAHYFSNIGAEVLAEGDALRALGYFERALDFDAEFRPALVNMAVAYRRLDRPAEAEATLLQVLDAEPGNSVAAANLASLYVALGRDSDALQWLERRQAFLDRNPFHHFRLGMSALRDDVPETARAHFKRAIDLQPRESVFYEQLANAYLELGEIRRARASLRRAMYLTDDQARRDLLLERLRNNPRRSGAA